MNETFLGQNVRHPDILRESFYDLIEERSLIARYSRSVVLTNFVATYPGIHLAMLRVTLHCALG